MAHWTVVGDVFGTSNRKAVPCVCSCGKRANVKIAKGGALRSKSCHTCATVTHGHTRGGRDTTTYSVWRSMVDRCHNELSKDYARYGGRGIRVCEEWNDYRVFLRDMGERPSGTSIDRIDNSSGYNPTNCRWSTARQQCRNKRNNRVISCNNVSKTLAEWSEITGVYRCTITDRLRRGLTPEQALFTPVGKR